MQLGISRDSPRGASKIVKVLESLAAGCTGKPSFYDEVLASSILSMSFNSNLRIYVRLGSLQVCVKLPSPFFVFFSFERECMICQGRRRVQAPAKMPLYKNC